MDFLWGRLGWGKGSDWTSMLADAQTGRPYDWMERKSETLIKNRLKILWIRIRPLYLQRQSPQASQRCSNRGRFIFLFANVNINRLIRDIF
jgi:hypothetical protein